MRRRSFQGSNGDGIGDLPDITSRLSHIANLGVDATSISPFFISPQKDFGYDVAATLPKPIWGGKSIPRGLASFRGVWRTTMPPACHNM